jgi:stage III sporulation protein SpoIIIAA
VAALPAAVAAPLRALPDYQDLVEVILDLGRRPIARFLTGEVPLADWEVERTHLEHVVAAVGSFGDDNRAGIEYTLHRISALRNRGGAIVGLTCRRGRAIYGRIEIIRDIIESGTSLLLLGRPGVGKTTMLREVARVLAEELDKRVVVVDTSNEIAGDGDIPHEGIGRARRMMVPTSELQHRVMIEAVENHTPEAVIIDEIGTELEALAARTIAERGVQLVGTAHGITLENLLSNPTLSDLVGGVESVTLGDDEARRRGTQKTILERRAAPTFDALVEIQDRERVRVHANVAESVDAFLRQEDLLIEIRRQVDGKIDVEWTTLSGADGRAPKEAPRLVPEPVRAGPLRVYPFGISRKRVSQAIAASRREVQQAREISEADVVLTVRNYYRNRPDAIREAEERNVPVYVLRNSSAAQIQACLIDVADLHRAEQPDPIAAAAAAAHHVLQHSEPVLLEPANAYVRRRQHQIAERYNLSSESRGREPNRQVNIFSSRTGKSQ